MISPEPAGRPRYRGSSAAFAVVALLVGFPVASLAGPGSGRVAGPGRAAGSGPPPGGRYSPGYRHPYRHGVVPTIGRAGRTGARMAGLAPARAASAVNLSYGGGTGGIGVTTGREKVYLVFYGSQWGTKGTDANGDVTLSGDPSGEAPYLQELFKGLGTDGESWSRVVTQYCEGVARGAQTCPASAPHAAYPLAPALAGVWADESAASPGAADGHQLGAEAVRAATHFGNTSGALNRNADYVILSPTGSNPDGFNIGGDFCAWHDWNGDPTLTGGPVTSPDGHVAFTNLPYLTDAGSSCGANFVNASGPLDGVSIVAGHEFAETVTDQNPPGGWTDSQGNEIADKCAWLPPGFPGGAGDVVLATGTFAMQSVWSNSASGGRGGCELGGVFNGGFETGTLAGWQGSGKATAVVSSGVLAGKYAAQAGKPVATNGTSSIAQTFTAGTRQLSFWYDVRCAGTITHNWATAVLSDNTGHATVTVLGKRCQKNSGWKQVTHALIVGHEYTLTLTNKDGRLSGAGTHTLIDSVSAS